MQSFSFTIEDIEITITEVKHVEPGTLKIAAETIVNYCKYFSMPIDVAFNQFNKFKKFHMQYPPQLTKTDKSIIIAYQCDIFDIDIKLELYQDVDTSGGEATIECRRLKDRCAKLENEVIALQTEFTTKVDTISKAFQKELKTIKMVNEQYEKELIILHNEMKEMMDMRDYIDDRFPRELYYINEFKEMYGGSYPAKTVDMQKLCTNFDVEKFVPYIKEYVIADIKAYPTSEFNQFNLTMINKATSFQELAYMKNNNQLTYLLERMSVEYIIDKVENLSLIDQVYEYGTSKNIHQFIECKKYRYRQMKYGVLERNLPEYEHSTANSTKYCLKKIDPPVKQKKVKSQDKPGSSSIFSGLSILSK